MIGNRNVYCAEVYTRHPETGEAGWEIMFVWVWADTIQEARERVRRETPNFDTIIKLDQQCEIFPLSGCTALVLPDRCPVAAV